MNGDNKIDQFIVNSFGEEEMRGLALCISFVGANAQEDVPSADLQPFLPWTEKISLLNLGRGIGVSLCFLGSYYKYQFRENIILISRSS
jgi:hypothetical protein